MSNGARIGIAIGIFALVVALLMGFSLYRRRRIQRANLAFINNPNNSAGYGGYGGSGVGAMSPPQYPPQTHWGGGPVGGGYGGYDAQTGFAPVSTRI
jgi:hypothetical protein